MKNDFSTKINFLWEMLLMIKHDEDKEKGFESNEHLQMHATLLCIGSDERNNSKKVWAICSNQIIEYLQHPWEQ